MLMQKRQTGILAAIAASTLILFSGTANAADPLDESLKIEKKIIRSAAASQKRITKLADATMDLSQDYKITMQRVDNLREYNRQYEAQIRNQEEEMASIQDQMSKIDDTEKGVVPLMNDMIDTLESFIEADIPFHAEERKARVQRLRDNMFRADLNNSEKYRQILGAYQVEMQYGEVLESYPGKATVNGQELKVNYLLFGRIALVWQSLDETSAAYWDANNKNWVALDDDYRIHLRKAIKIANRHANDDLIVLPINAAKAAGSAQ